MQTAYKKVFILPNAQINQHLNTKYMNKIKHATIIVLLFIVFMALIAFSAFAQAIQIPQPIGTVNDFAGIIDATSKQNIANAISEINQKTTAEIAVVTIESLDGIPKEEYAIELAQKWGIGKKQNDNGILILVAKQERQYRIELGRGLEGLINDAKAGRIGRQIIVPNFQKNQYGKGIYEAIIEIQGLLENKPEVIARYTQKEDKFGLFVIPYFLITLAITFISFSSKKIKWPALLGWDIATLLLAIFLALFFEVLVIIIIALIFGLSARFGKNSGRGIGGISGRGFGGSFGSSSGGGFGGGSFSGGGSGGNW